MFQAHHRVVLFQSEKYRTRAKLELLANVCSLSSVLSARSAIIFFWKINSSSDCPTDSKFVSLFLKGVERKFKKIPKKAYPISYDELQQIFNFVIGDSDIESLPFVELRFITYLLQDMKNWLLLKLRMCSGKMMG